VWWLPLPGGRSGSPSGTENAVPYAERCVGSRRGSVAGRGREQHDGGGAHAPVSVSSCPGRHVGRRGEGKSLRLRVSGPPCEPFAAQSQAGKAEVQDVIGVVGGVHAGKLTPLDGSRSRPRQESGGVL
jgi:hypothetical protein